MSNVKLPVSVKKTTKSTSPARALDAAKRRDLTERLNKLREESKALAESASQLLARVS